MTGPEHYAEAARIAAGLAEISNRPAPHNHEAACAIAAVAQVHATLALAAATALSTVTEESPQAEFDAWHAVAGVVPTRPASQDGGDQQ